MSNPEKPLMPHPTNLITQLHLYYNNRLAVKLVTQQHEPYATLSVNIDNVPLGPNEFIVKGYSENLGLDDISRYGVFEDTGRRVDLSQFVKNQQIWRLKPEYEPLIGKYT